MSSNTTAAATSQGPSPDSIIYLEKAYRLSQAFRPSAPIDRRDLFSGRSSQMGEIVQVIGETGQHAVLYGERGVGKTSLTAVVAEILAGVESANLCTVRVNCDGSDDFSSVWRKVFAELSIKLEKPGMGFNATPQTTNVSASALLPSDGKLTPNDIRRALLSLPGRGGVVVFIDEFDRIPDSESKTLFADTIKLLSDHLMRATVVFVGVADNVDQLITEHKSIERALVQIQMPRMSLDELEDIVQRGLTMVGMESSTEATARIAQLSQGLPHYTHLLGQLAARTALEMNRLEITVNDVDVAVTKARERAQESIISAYHKAIFSTRENLYERVLAACALAEKDAMGYFAASDVRDPLSAIMGKRYEIPAFSRHLNAMCEPDRGPVLQKAGATRRFRFRFLNPLLQPYVVMTGLAERYIDPELLTTFAFRP